MTPHLMEEQMISPSPTVEGARCPHFGACNGCQLQNLGYDAQLAQKSERLQALLATADLALPPVQVHPSPPFGYRNRIRLTLSEMNCQLRAGYLANQQAAASNPQLTFLAIAECPIAAPILWRAAKALIALLNRRSVIWLERTPFSFDQLELFTTADESQLQVSLYVRTSAKHLPTKFTVQFASLCESLREEIPALAGAGIYLLPPRSARGRRSEQPRLGTAWGSPGVNYAVANLNEQPATSYWVPRGAFFQVNRFLLPELVSLVTNGRRGELAWDLYAGVGLFTRALAPNFARITAVEVAEPAFTALASAKLRNRHAIKGATLDFLRAAVVERDRPDVIVLDPPRTGAGPEICELLARIAAPTVVYVSCSPESLPADLATLAASGYRVAELHLLDLFPQTTHIETVTVVTR